MAETFLIEKALRYDVKGKKYINISWKCADGVRGNVIYRTREHREQDGGTQSGAFHEAADADEYVHPVTTVKCVMETIAALLW